MDADTYKAYHEQHMMFNNGTSRAECGMLLSSIPVCVFFSLFLSPIISKKKEAVVQFVLIILPVILNVTIFSEVHHLLLFSLILLYLFIMMTNTNVKSISKILKENFQDERSIITNYRASTNFVSAICILAVDFKIFPKRFAKTEAFGFGLMDLGVGFFVCSNGLVERHWQEGQATRKRSPLKVFNSCAILFSLGLIRLIAVKATGYHEHVTEYGTHWNFFFTLTFCKVLIYFIQRFSNLKNPLWLTIITGLLHEVLLNVKLKSWVISTIPRDTFLSANREGLTSCLGYISIYFAGITIGRFITCSQERKTYQSLIAKLFLIYIISEFVTLAFFKTTGISRRLVNLGYILWVVSLSVIELVFFLVAELSILAIKQDKLKFNKTDSASFVPCLLQSINVNALFFFLLSNLLTGLINSLFQTLLLGHFLSLLLIVTYMLILSAITYYKFVKRISINYNIKKLFTK